MIVVRETSPGVFIVYDGGIVQRLCTIAQQQIAYGDGRTETAEIEVEPYIIEERVPLPVADAWTDEELAERGLYRAVRFVTPEGKITIGERRFERVDGVVCEVFDTEDAPPPPPPPTPAEKLAALGLTPEDLRALLAGDA